MFFFLEISWIEQPSGKTCFTIHRFRTLFFSWRTSAVPGCFGGNLWEFRRLNHGTNSSWMCVLFPGGWRLTSTNAMYWSMTRISANHKLKNKSIKGIMDEHTMSNVEILTNMSKKKNWSPVILFQQKSRQLKANQYQILRECCQAQMNFYATSLVKTPMIRAFHCSLLTPPIFTYQGAPNWRRQTSGDINDTKNREVFLMDLFLKSPT